MVYAERMQAMAVVASVVAAILLMAHSIYEYVVHLSVSIPYTHTEVGVPVIDEGNFSRSQGGIPLSGLPWVLDDARHWSEAERAEASSGCGLVRLCAARYPIWCAEVGPRAAEACAGGGERALLAPGVLEPAALGKTLELVDGPELILEREPTVELVLSARGLWVRRGAM